MPGTPILMNFAVTASSHTLGDYRARGSYGALAKALAQMRPEDVTREVTASGLQGRGGAAFPVGRKWAVVKLDDGQPHYLCANADEGELGTFKDRWVLEHAPHLLIEAMLITSYALGVRHSFVYIRGEFDLPYRRLAAAVEEAYAAGLLGRAHPRQRVLLRRLHRLATTGSDGSNKWVGTLTDGAGNDMGVARSTATAEIAANVVESLSGLTTNLTVAKGEALLATFTKTGAPTDLTTAKLSVVWHIREA